MRAPADRVVDPHATSPQDLGRRGFVLLAAGTAIALLVRPVGPLDVVWNPLLAGLVLLSAAASTGRRSPLPATRGFAVSTAGVAAPAVFLGLGS